MLGAQITEQDRRKTYLNIKDEAIEQLSTLREEILSKTGVTLH